MPKRGEEVVQKPTRQRKSAEPVKEQKEEVTTGKVVRKSPLEESFRKMCEAAEPGLSEKINDVSERFIKDGDTKIPVLFATFSKNGAQDEEVDNEFNVESIKTVLFHYHTSPEDSKGKSSKVPFIEVLPPEGDDAIHLLCYHEE